MKRRHLSEQQVGEEAEGSSGGKERDDKVEVKIISGNVSSAMAYIFNGNLKLPDAFEADKTIEPRMCRDANKRRLKNKGGWMNRKK